MRSFLVSLTTALVLVSPHASAEEGGQATGSPTALARGRDASIDRGFLTAHAETIGEGQWAFNAYELIFIGLTYGFTDDIQASISTLLPIVEDIGANESWVALGVWAIVFVALLVNLARTLGVRRPV